MVKRSLLLAVLFSSWAGSQTMDYVPDVAASASSQKTSVKVDAGQSSATLGVTCSYRVTNGAKQPIYIFQVGAFSTAAKGLPTPPLHWNQPSPGATPPGWFETSGSGPGGYSMGWQARTSKDLIQPGESRNFSFDLSAAEGFQCGTANWMVGFATVYPVLDFPPTSLSITLSNLQITSNRGFAGDVSIENLGPNDAVLNLGMTLGNGRSIPRQISMVARGSDGRVYNFFPGGPAGAAGRVDPMVIHLRQHSAYAIHCTWVAPRELTPGGYAFHVEFEGSPARDPNPDMRDVNLVRYWLGKVKSNDVTLAVQ